MPVAPPLFEFLEVKGLFAPFFVRASLLCNGLAPASTWNVTTDSRKVDKNSIFIAYKGVKQDGHSYLLDVLKKSPYLVILEDESFLPEGASLQVPFIVVKSGRKAWSTLMRHYYGNPQNSLRLIAVTGTNGKSSTVWFIRELLRLQGIECATIGTLGIYLKEEILPNAHTTPDPDVLFALLRRLKDENYSYVAMEVSSQSLAHDKLAGVLFDCAIFTSFSRDHLDFHQTMEDYWEAKSLLFTSYLKKDAPCYLASSLPALPKHEPSALVSVYGFAANPFPSLSFTSLSHYEAKSAGASFTLTHASKESLVEMPFLGRHNAENITASLLASASLLKNTLPTHLVTAMHPVPGRMQKINLPGLKNAPLVFVDYAHTEDALRRALSSLRESRAHKIVLVFGCGGQRDRGKRPLMAACAEELADEIILTSDNPRLEAQENIKEDIVKGFSQNCSYTYEPDRAKAIFAAIQTRNPKHVILIAGKGHEKEQLIAGKSYPFDDCAVAAEALAKGYRDAK